MGRGRELKNARLLPLETLRIGPAQAARQAGRRGAAHRTHQAFLRRAAARRGGTKCRCCAVAIAGSVAQLGLAAEAGVVQSSLGLGNDHRRGLRKGEQHKRGAKAPASEWQQRGRQRSGGTTLQGGPLIQPSASFQRSNGPQPKPHPPPAAVPRWPA